MYQTNEFRKNLKIEYEGSLWRIEEAQFVKPGKGVAFVKTKIKNLLDGRTVQINFRSGDKVGKPDVMDVKMQVLYSDGNAWHFMDNKTYDQMEIVIDELGDAALYLQEGLEVSVLLYNGRPIDIELPNFIESEIVDCEPGVKGDTVQGGTKPAKIETGAVVQVPLFVNQGERIKVDTRTGEYSSRVK
ncbi:MAG: elongation factor P [Myxococcota bacterium]|nr:elongation factor P [Myxococcota bacterium]